MTMLEVGAINERKEIIRIIEKYKEKNFKETGWLDYEDGFNTGAISALEEIIDILSGDEK